MRIPHVYFLRPIGVDGPIKIGCSMWPEERLTTIASWSPIPLELAARLPGNMKLEGRFHARFAEYHSHGEWFRACPDLLSAIERIRAGTFDLDELPVTGRRPGPGRRVDPESARAGGACLRLTMLQRKGVVIPPEVLEARHTWRCTAEEKARRRALVRSFVDTYREAA